MIFCLLYKFCPARVILHITPALIRSLSQKRSFGRNCGLSAVMRSSAEQNGADKRGRYAKWSGAEFCI